MNYEDIESSILITKVWPRESSLNKVIINTFIIDYKSDLWLIDLKQFQEKLKFISTTNNENEALF